MKRLILLVALALFTMSSTPKYGDYILITNNSYKAQQVTLFYDYNDGYWTPVESAHLPGSSSKTFHADTSMLYKYAYRSSNMPEIRQVYSEHIQLY